MGLYHYCVRRNRLFGLLRRDLDIGDSWGNKRKEMEKEMKPARLRTYIGIDPDVDKSGVACIKENTISLNNLRFFELYDYLSLKKSEIHLIVIEAGWLNRSNWHTSAKGSAALNAKIGSRTGANHETGKKIVEMVEYLGINYRLSRPTKSKVDAKFFKAVCGITYRTNQEQRDAYMMIHGLKNK